jgi:hypothetical protein
MRHISESSMRFPPYRAAEVSDLRWEQPDFKAAVLPQTPRFNQLWTRSETVFLEQLVQLGSSLLDLLVRGPGSTIRPHKACIRLRSPV